MRVAIALLIALGILGAVLWWRFDIAATSPHSALVEALLHETMEHAVGRSAAGIVPPALDDAALVAEGARHYFAMCEGCHAGPGVDPSELAQGLYPAPPPLHEEEEWSDAELFWITKHGIKHSGMPAYGPTHTDDALWATVGFVRILPGMAASAYESFRPERPPGSAPPSQSHHHEGHDHSGHAH